MESQSFFAEDLHPRILGATPVLTADFWAQEKRDQRPVYERETEVRKWLHEHGAVHDLWLALDEQASLFAPSSEHLVLCDSRVGLTQRELDFVDEVLAKFADRASTGEACADARR